VQIKGPSIAAMATYMAHEHHDLCTERERKRESEYEGKERRREQKGGSDVYESGVERATTKRKECMVM
jgi:hypothetical protein